MSSFAVVDLGTKKIVAAIARPAKDGGLEILAVQRENSRGMGRGVIKNLREVKHILKSVIEIAERDSDSVVEDVYINLSGVNADIFTALGKTVVTGETITRKEILRAIETAKRITIPQHREIIHVIPTRYIVDDQEVEEPEGMFGTVLQVQVQIITHLLTVVKNFENCVERAGFYLKEFVLSQVADIYSLVNDEDRELGVMIVDIGAETTDVALVLQNEIHKIFSYEIGGKDFTNDIAIGLNTSMKEAERIKVKYARLFSDTEEEVIKVPLMDGGERNITSNELYSIIFPRAEQLFTWIQEDIERAGWELKATSGIMLTGGGSLLSGLKKFASSFFNTMVRISGPRNTSRLLNLDDEFTSPEYSTFVGILKYAQEREQFDGKSSSGFLPSIKNALKNIFGKKSGG